MVELYCKIKVVETIIVWVIMAILVLIAIGILISNAIDEIKYKIYKKKKEKEE